MFNNVFANKKVLISGNTGFKGSWLTVWLLKLGAEIYGLSNGIPTNPSMFSELGLDNKIKHYTGDIRDLGMVTELLAEVKPDFVFHLAAQPIVVKSYLDPIETITTNVIGTANVLDALKTNNNPCTAIIITSDKCYDNVEWVWGYKETDILGGKDIYSGSKGAAELIIKSYYHSFFKDHNRSNVKIISVRAGNVIGGGDWAEHRIIPDCIRGWSKGEAVIIRNPDSTRPWQHVLEPLSGYLTACDNLYSNNSLNGFNFNFGPNPEYSNSVKEIITDLSKFFKLNNLSSLYEIVEDKKYHEAKLLKLNSDKAFYYLKWLPTLDYNKVIEFTGTWYNRFYSGDKNELFDFTVEQIAQYESIAKNKRIKWSLA